MSNTVLFDLKTSPTARLYLEPSITEGIARILDLGNKLEDYNISKNETEADVKALQGDWAAIGNDLSQALNTYNSTTN